MQLTNVVCMVHLKCEIDLKHLVSASRDVIYDPRKHNCLIWRHKKIRGCCILSKSGKMMCNGAASSTQEAKKRVRRYARLVQKAGFSIVLDTIRVVTMSAVHTLNQSLDLKQLYSQMGGIYEPELFPALMVKRNGIHFSCFRTGKVIITGIKNMEDVYPTILELMI